MAIRGEWVRFGQPALDRLARLVAEFKGGDPLAPVTVVVPTNPVGVVARRALGRAAGVANVEFVTVGALAYRLAAGDIGRRDLHRLTDQVLVGAVRQALATSGGPLRHLAAHPSAPAAIASSLSRLRRADAIDRVRRGRQVVAAVAALHGSVAARLTDFVDDVEVAQIALEVLRRAAGPHAPVAVHLPEWLYPAERSLLTELAQRTEMVVLFGHTGDPVADAVTEHLAELLGVSLPARPAEPSANPARIHVKAPDADEACRQAVAWVIEQRRADPSLSWADVAILYPSSELFHRSIHRHLQLAGVPFNGPAMTRFDQSRLGAVMARLVDLAASPQPTRSAVMAVLRCPGVRGHDGGSARPVRWERWSRQAGIIAGGAEVWHAHLALLAARVRSSTSPRAAEDAEGIENFAALVTGLVRRAQSPPPEGSPWSEFVDWFDDLVRSVVPVSPRQHWSDDDQQHAEHLAAAVDGLRILDDVDPAPSLERFLAAVRVELDRSTGRTGRLGDGVLVAPLAGGWGTALSAVAVVGANEGILPRPVRSDAVLGAGEHELVGHDLGGESLGYQRRRWLAAIGEVPVIAAISVTHDLRTGRTQEPSRWVSDWPETVIPSFVAALGASASDPRTPAEHDLGALVGGPLRPGIIDAVPELSRGAVLVLARRFGGLGPWAGLVNPSHVAGVLEREMSATPLERYATCPARFFYADVLGIRVDEAPESVAGVDPRDRGDLVHGVLEAVVGGRIARGRHDRRAEEADLKAELARRLELLAGSGRTGRRLRFEAAVRDIRNRLDAFWDADSQLRAEGTAIEVEWDFGEEVGRPVRWERAGGPALRLRGRVDRIDRRNDGSLAVVDYKTRSRSRWDSQLDTQVAVGTLLQLPIYAHAAAAHLGGPVGRAALINLPSNGGAQVADLSDPAGVSASATIDVLVGHIEAGHFPAVPGPTTEYPRPTYEHCSYCEFDVICPADRVGLWERTQGDAVLETFVSLGGRDGV
jgi:ATP-dependent helicase/nuclease subunit B